MISLNVGTRRLAICLAGLAATLVVPAAAQAWEFTPDISFGADPMQADQAPTLTQTLERGAGDWEQPIRDLTATMPLKWRVNGRSLVQQCHLADVKAGTCEQNDSGSVAGKITAEVGTFFDKPGDPPLATIEGSIYQVNPGEYYADPETGNRPDWVAAYPGDALPVVNAFANFRLVRLGNWQPQDGVPLGDLVKPIYMTSVLSLDHFRIENDIVGMDAQLQRGLGAVLEMRSLKLELDGGEDLAQFRTPPRGVCQNAEVFNISARSYADPGYADGLDWADPEQTVGYPVDVQDFDHNVVPLSGCDTADAPFAPKVSVSTSTSAAGKNPDLRMAIDRASGDAYFSSMKLGLPEGMVGSPYAASETCQLDQANQDVCPAGAKVGETTMTISVYESRPLSLTANVYNAPVEGSELARFYVVARTPPIALQQVTVLPVTLDVRPGVKGIDATLTDIPTEFDIRHIEFTFLGTTGASSGHPLLINPSACNPGDISVEFTSEMGHTYTAQAPYQTTDCDALAFGPKTDVQLSCSEPHCAPDITATMTQPAGEATTSEMRVAIPPAFVFNKDTTVQPCSAADVSAHSCSDSNQIGTATAETPLALEPLTGKIYLAEQDPGDTTSLRRIHAEISGLVDLSLDGGLVPGANGGFETVMSGLPQVPLTKMELKLTGGTDKGLVLTPYECGDQQFVSTMTSHSGKVATNTATVNISGTSCAPTLNARLSPDEPKAHPRLDLIVRPRKGTALLKQLKINLGSGSHKIKVRGVSLTGSEKRAARRRGSGRLSKAIEIGKLKIKGEDGSSSQSKLLSKGGSKVLTKTGKSKGALSLSGIKVKLSSKGKVIVTGLPDQPWSELVIRIEGGKRNVLTNPKRCGDVTFSGALTDANGQAFSTTAKDKVPCTK